MQTENRTKLDCELMLRKSGVVKNLGVAKNLQVEGVWYLLVDSSKGRRRTRYRHVAAVFSRVLQRSELLRRSHAGGRCRSLPTHSLGSNRCIRRTLPLVGALVLVACGANSSLSAGAPAKSEATSAASGGAPPVGSGGATSNAPAVAEGPADTSPATSSNDPSTSTSSETVIRTFKSPYPPRVTLKSCPAGKQARTWTDALAALDRRERVVFRAHLGVVGPDCSTQGWSDADVGCSGLALFESPRAQTTGAGAVPTEPYLRLYSPFTGLPAYPPADPNTPIHSGPHNYYSCHFDSLHFRCPIEVPDEVSRRPVIATGKHAGDHTLFILDMCSVENVLAAENAR